MFWVMISAVLFFIDYFIKKWAVQNLKEGERKPIGKSRFSLQLIYNKGFAGSKMKHSPAIVMTIHGIVLVLLSLYCIFSDCFKRGYKWSAFGFSLILGGGASNLFDRIKQGKVTDYLGLPVLRKLVFNVSDLFIFLGTILVFLSEFHKQP